MGLRASIRHNRRDVESGLWLTTVPAGRAAWLGLRRVTASMANKKPPDRVVIESNDEQSLSEIRNQFEVFLRAARTLVEGEVTMASPLVRPQPKSLPMDTIEGFANTIEGIANKYGASVELRAGDQSVTLTSETAQRAAEMLASEE
jgi:hypothetical protein